MADPKLYFSIDDSNDSVELFRVTTEGAVEWLPSGTEPGGLQDLAAGRGQIVSVAGRDGIDILDGAEAALADGPANGVEVDAFIATGFDRSDLIADYDVVEGEEIELEELLDFATLAERAPEGRDAVPSKAAEPAEKVGFSSGDMPETLTIVIDDDPGDTPVTI